MHSTGFDAAHQNRQIRQPDAATLRRDIHSGTLAAEESVLRRIVATSSANSGRPHHGRATHGTAHPSADNLCSIAGIGKKTAIVLIALTRNMEVFDTARQVSSYFGLCPRIYESGYSVKGSAGICKMGMVLIRKLLYMCALSAKKCNRACRQMYERLLAKGKSKKLILMAIANKLLKQAFAVIKNKTPDDLSTKVAY